MSDTSRSRSTGVATRGAAEAIVAGLMPSLKADLDELIRIPSIGAQGSPRGPLVEAHELVVELLMRAGVAHVETLALHHAAPIVYAEIPAPEGGPTLLLYSHYDVAPAGDEHAWTSRPFEPIERGDAIYGRGAADSKANVIAHVGALHAWEGRPPVGIKVVVDGEAELGSGTIAAFCRTRPDVVRADAMVIADAGNPNPGVPALTVALLGTATAYAADTSGPAYEAAIAAMSEAWGQTPALVPSDGSMPVLAALHAAVPEAEILLLGATDGQSNSHAPDERVLIGEFERTVVAETKFFREFAARVGSRGRGPGPRST